MIEIRPAIGDDLVSIVSVYNRAHPEDAPASGEILQWTLDRADAARPHKHLVAVVDTKIAGRGTLRGIPEMESRARDRLPICPPQP